LIIAQSNQPVLGSAAALINPQSGVHSLIEFGPVYFPGLPVRQPSPAQRLYTLNYISTRGGDERLSLAALLTRGTAANGGLFVPEQWPSVPAGLQDQLKGGDYADIASRILDIFGADAVPGDLVPSAIHAAMDRFDQPVGPPLTQLGDEALWCLELIHGPTLAFKDFALAPLAEIIDRTLIHSDRRATVLCATSGDTGAATVSAFANRQRLNAVVLFPAGGVSDFQRRQMTTTNAPNILPISVDGDFDDCQRLVKSLYQTEAATAYGYTAVNSINIVRILLQCAYYLRSASLLSTGPDDRINFVVPTGNFGNVYAAYIARQLGAPINRLIVSSNENDVLPRLFDTGRMQGNQTVKTISPSMDIQVSSNFERLLWHIKNNDGAAVEQLQTDLEQTNNYTLTEADMSLLHENFGAIRCSKEDAFAAMQHIYRTYQKVICPHTATAVHAAQQLRSELGGKTVIVETAHPAKFADAVEQAIGSKPPLPASAEAVLNAEEHFTTANAREQDIQQLIDARFGDQKQ
jgi:threonine synthase